MRSEGETERWLMWTRLSWSHNWKGRMPQELPLWTLRDGSTDPLIPIVGGCSLGRGGGPWTLPDACSVFLRAGHRSSSFVSEGHRTKCRKSSVCLETDTKVKQERREMSPAAALRETCRAEEMWKRPKNSTPRDWVCLPDDEQKYQDSCLQERERKKIVECKSA